MRNQFLPILLLTGLLLSSDLKSQNPVILGIIEDSTAQFIVTCDLITHVNDTIFNLPPPSAVEFWGSGGSDIDPYNERYFFTNGTTDSLAFYDIINSQLSATQVGGPPDINYVCGSLEYDQFMNALIWLTMDQLQIYNIDSNSLSTYTIPSLHSINSCSGQSTAYNFMQQQLFCMPSTGGGNNPDTTHWLIIDVPSQQVVLNQAMPDSMSFYGLVYSPLTGKYYGSKTSVQNNADVYEIDPFNLSAIKITSLPGDGGNGNFFFDAMFDISNNRYILPTENAGFDSTNMNIYNLSNNTLETFAYSRLSGTDRNELLSIPQRANIVYRNGNLMATKGQSYSWFFNDSLMLNTGINYITPTQSGYYKANVITANNTFATDSVYVDLTGIKEITEPYLRIFPNPASDNLSIQTTDFNPQLFSIYDIAGSKVIEEKYAPEIDISSLPTGTYFITLRGQETTVTKMFVKMK